MTSWLRGGRKVRVQQQLVLVSSNPQNALILANHYNIVNTVFEASIVLLCLDKKLKCKENKVMKHNSIIIITIYNVSDVVYLIVGCPRISSYRK